MKLTQRERDIRAVRSFFALEIGRAQRAIVTHQPHARGWCLGCGGLRYTAWPCWLFELATDVVRAHDTAIARAEFVDACIPRQRTPALAPYRRLVAARPMPERHPDGRFVAGAR